MHTFSFNRPALDGADVSATNMSWQVALVLVALVLVVATAGGARAGARARAGPTTIVTILADDLGYHDTQLNNPLAPTPFLGNLTAQGMVRATGSRAVPVREPALVPVVGC